MRGWQMVCGLALLGLPMCAGTAQADDYAPRQYYGEWQYSPKQDYCYRTYYYKPEPSYTGYKHHYVIATPAEPKHYYFYNPYKKQYWGRCSSSYGDYSEGHYYSQLAPSYRKEHLHDISERSFPPPGPLPGLPEARDGAKLDLPPDNGPPPFPPGAGGQPVSSPAPAGPPGRP